MKIISKLSLLNKRGFTLIELMLVVAIIVIVVAITVISLSSARTKSKVAAFNSQLHSMQALAVSTCDSAVLSNANISGPTSGISYIGTITFGLNSQAYTNNNGIGQNCGVPGAGGGIFNFTVASTGISPACTATVRDTGVIISCL